MSVVVTIQGTPIEFPTTGESPNWAPAVVEFAQATEQALLTAAGPFDVPPTVDDITSFIPTNAFNNVVKLNFSPATVRSVQISYALSFSGPVATEAGTLQLLYDASKALNEKWSVLQEYIGETSSEIKVLDDGQLQLKVPTTYTSGKFSFSAKVLEQV